MSLDIKPEKRMPFVNDDGTFYCNICKTYTPNFAPSYVKRRDRRCRMCLAKQRFERVLHLSHLQRLRNKLYHNLLYQGKKDYARCVTVDTVSQLLQKYNIKEDDYALVKTFCVVFDPVSEMLRAYPVYYNLSHLAKDIDK